MDSKKEQPKKPTVMCPLHHLPLEVQVKDKRMIAVCNCNVPNNNHKGHVVWEREDTRRVI